MKIAAAQMNIVDGEPDQNKALLKELLDQAQSIDLLLAPELWTSGYKVETWASIADHSTPDILKWMSEEAKDRNLWLGGTLISRNEQNALVNRFFLFNRSGQIACQYDKAHLFAPLREPEFMVAGSIPPPIVDFEGIRLAPSICYDLRFPEMFRRLALRGVDLFLVSSEWPLSRVKAFQTLSEARAIENQTFLIASNRVGTDSLGNEFAGRSGIYGPEGVLAIEDGLTNALVETTISLETLQSIRKKIPVFSDRIKELDY